MTMQQPTGDRFVSANVGIAPTKSVLQVGLACQAYAQYVVLGYLKPVRFVNDIADGILLIIPTRLSRLS